MLPADPEGRRPMLVAPAAGPRGAPQLHNVTQPVVEDEVDPDPEQTRGEVVHRVEEVTDVARARVHVRVELVHLERRARSVAAP